jgi:hypothetical protein
VTLRPWSSSQTVLAAAKARQSARKRPSPRPPRAKRLPRSRKPKTIRKKPPKKAPLRRISPKKTRPTAKVAVKPTPVSAPAQPEAVRPTPLGRATRSPSGARRAYRRRYSLLQPPVSRDHPARVRYVARWRCDPRTCSSNAASSGSLRSGRRSVASSHTRQPALPQVRAWRQQTRTHGSPEWRVLRGLYVRPLDTILAT